MSLAVGWIARRARCAADNVQNIDRWMDVHVARTKDLTLKCCVAKAHSLFHDFAGDDTTKPWHKEGFFVFVARHRPVVPVAADDGVAGALECRLELLRWNRDDAGRRYDGHATPPREPGPVLRTVRPVARLNGTSNAQMFSR